MEKGRNFVGWGKNLVENEEKFSREGEEICGEETGKLDPVGSTVRYDMMKLCTGLV